VGGHDRPEGQACANEPTHPSQSIVTKPRPDASQLGVKGALAYVGCQLGRSGGADPNRLTRDSLGQRSWAALLGRALGQRSWGSALGQSAATVAALGLVRGQSYQEDVVIAILLTVCLIGDPGTCRDYKITLSPGVTLTQCLMTAPPHIAKWSEEHPGWHVERWQCGNASREDI
jgi:hypothetical protein